MTTKRLVLDLIAFALAIAFVFTFVPWALNATDTLTNVLGISVIVSVIIAVVATVHNKVVTQLNAANKEKR